MPKTISFPAPLVLLMLVTILAALSTWFLPAGQYNKLSVSGQSFLVTTPNTEIKLPFTQNTLDSLQLKISIQKFIDGDIRKPVALPGTYQKINRNSQGPLQILQAPIKGIYDSVDIIMFILIIGSFMFIFNETGAMLKGISYLSYIMKGREPMLIAVLVFTFAFLRSSYGMEEEALVFYPILVPLFIAAGYDLLVPLAIIFGGTSVGGLAGFSNPFSVIIASNAAGINWMDGLYSRLLLFVLATAYIIWYILRYAAKVKKDPGSSLVFKIDGIVKPPNGIVLSEDNVVKSLDLRTKILLGIFFLTFISMIIGVVLYNWWTLEMSALFLGSSIFVAMITRMSGKTFIDEFIKGAGSLLSVAFIVGVARGITIILNDGHVSDSILYYSSILAMGLSPVILIIGLLIFYFVFTFFISSSSGMAVLTMPIMGALAIIVNIPGREVVNSYVYGMNLMFFVSPTSLILPSLALVGISLKVWIKFITPALIFLTILCAIFLLFGLYY